MTYSRAHNDIVNTNKRQRRHKCKLIEALKVTNFIQRCKIYGILWYGRKITKDQINYLFNINRNDFLLFLVPFHPIHLWPKQSMSRLSDYFIIILMSAKVTARSNNPSPSSLLAKKLKSQEITHETSRLLHLTTLC